MTTAAAEVTEKQNGLNVDSQQYLTFDLAEEHYGVDILKVQEIKGYTAVTKIPNTPEHVKGVLNLRGTIVPIVDLRLKFNMAPTEPTAFTVIVVVNVQERVMGFLVDAVSDVLELAGKDIQPPPELGKRADITFVSGIGNTNDRLVTLLDIDRVMAETDVEAITASSSDREAKG
ncbi:MAG: chemotaxis protein CheW [Nitrospirales bacterium]|nr:MAG: chemotaxis protein CheW [Nitrospirales bacterium]